MARGNPSRRGGLIALLLAAIVVAAAALFSGAAHAIPDDENHDVTLYFFWAEGCPHCAAAKPTLADFEKRHHRLTVRAFEVTGSAENRQLFSEMAAKFGIRLPAVPTFFLGDRYWVGYTESTTPGQLDMAIVRCLSTGCPDAGAGVLEPGPSGAPLPALPPTPTDVISLPLIGDVDVGTHSLAVTTALIAAVDGFNPCSLWVLSILLALTLRTGSRRTIAVIGLVYIFVTALVYALFIGGLFSVFSIVTVTPWVRVVVALFATGFAVINIKDFFWFRKGVSLTIPESGKPVIYQRIRGVLSVADSMPAMIAATVVLAAGVSFVELACTAGFPILWTNIMAADEVSLTLFILLLALYMLIYQIDELAIFGVALVTLHSSRVQESQGRLLKLIGGMLMLSLAVVMLFKPSLMNEIGTSLIVFAAAAGATLSVFTADRVIRRWVSTRA
ncbi:MAG: thioredoxin family protein [Mycobacterium sp.]|nr:thioredoxin family protein [Mycobacterium sp.]